MRTTLSLDDDVAIALRKIQASEKKGFKEIVNEALRVGLKNLLMPSRRAKKFRTKSVPLGRCLVGSLDDISRALELAEGDRFK